MFARRGYAAATVQEIAAECGRTTGALFGHFATKEDLYLAMLDERAATRTLDLEAMGSEPAEAVDWLARWFDSRSGGEMGLLAMEFDLHAARDPRVRAKKRRQGRRARDELAAFLAAGFERFGQPPPRPVEELATLCIAVGEGLSALRFIDPNAASGEMFAYAVARICSGPGERDSAG